MKTNKWSFNPAGENAILVYFSFFKFLLLLFFAGNYGLFRDEFYYIECSKHLTWGYVDQPPFAAFALFVSRSLFGESIIGIRILAYAAGSVTVFISGLIARQLGGGKFAQALTAIAVIFSGVMLAASSYFSMNVFDHLLSALFFLYLIKLFKTDNPKLWYIIGIICGIGLMNKLSFLFLGFGLVIGLLITKQRKQFLKKELWIGGAIAFVMFLPNIIWQIINDYPTIEFMRNATEYKNVSMGIVNFFIGHLLEINPASSLLLAAAFYFFFFQKRGKEFSIFGWMYIIIFFVFVFNNGKPYYMGILVPVILAAGAVGIDLFIENYLKNWVRPVLVLVLLPGYLFTVPYVVPILAPETFISYMDFTGIKPESGEVYETSQLPQFYADRFGWEEMVQKVSEVFNSLSEEEKSKVIIAGQNYGQAGAVNYYREKYGLPIAVSPHNSFWIWGLPENFDGDMMIIIGGGCEGNKQWFEEVIPAAKHYNKYGMPYENVEIYICRKPRLNIKEMWKEVKNFI